MGRENPFKTISFLDPQKEYQIIRESMSELANLQQTMNSMAREGWRYSATMHTDDSTIVVLMER